ncbi:hypothetical protein [Agriterribacter sp.]|uniref:hypothetical protein n=1 Tax=Agriterribacter sp. TaxID=2821509 RepID=UPI002BF9CF98|nr:hypothetical protein [Agriterribacter sp.]HTN06515.1 hypothetical protein [Agriterribacter sp.]
MTCGEAAFKKELLDQGINTVVRRSDEGRLYGMTFIDHESKTVWNGSQLGKNLSANVFNDLWQQEVTQNNKGTLQDNTRFISSLNRTKDDDPNNDKEQTHEFFDFLYKDKPAGATEEFGLPEGLGGLLPQTQGEDYEELAFERQMRKKKRNASRKS